MEKDKAFLILSLTLILILQPKSAYGMHIMEGFLPPIWSITWGLVALPFVIHGFFSLRKTIDEAPKLKLLIAMAGAFAFLLSALKIPSITGSSSHPTGTGLGAILFGPTIMSVLGLIVLIFQALLLGHGGLTTLGANTFSMAVVGPFIAYAVYIIIRKANGPQWLGVFLATTLGNLSTYIMTSIQLALAFPAEAGGFIASLTKFMSIFALTQIPLSISEGVLTVLVIKSIASYANVEIPSLNGLTKET